MTLRTRKICIAALVVELATACDGSSEDSVTLEYAKRPLTQAGVTSSLTVDDDWGTGFCGSVSIVNKGKRPIRNWQLVLLRNGADFGRKWSGISVESRNHVLVSPTGQNASIPVGSTITVPFCGSGTGRPVMYSMSVDIDDVQG